MRTTASTPCPSSSSVSLIDPFFTGYSTATSCEDWAVILGPERAPPVACRQLTRVHLENIGILGDIAAGKEQTFGTLTECLLTWGRQGHLEFFNSTFVSTRGGASKAQKGLHLNEDI
jgi:hypothetical protein